MAKPSHEWRNILWREWRNCEDVQYAHYLFESLAGSRSIWLTPAIQIITGLFDNFGGLREVKWRNYDPSESVPFFVALILGLATGFVTGLIFGAETGLVAGLIIAALCFLLLMISLILLPKLRQRIGALFDRLYSQEQPTMAEVETALRQASRVRLKVQAIWAEPLHCLGKAKTASRSAGETHCRPTKYRLDNPFFRAIWSGCLGWCSGRVIAGNGCR